MEPPVSDRGKPDRADAHRALQEAMRAPDTFLSSQRDGRSAGLSKRLLVSIASRLVHFFASRQVEWNVAVVRALEATTRSLDDGDAWVGRLAEELRGFEARVRSLETELSAARAAEEEARRKLALAAIRLRELEERQAELARRLDGPAR
jgi:chromosome segregation ATPase